MATDALHTATASIRTNGVEVGVALAKRKPAPSGRSRGRHCSKENRDAVALVFAVHEVHALVRDPEACPGGAVLLLSYLIAPE
jgi:hypothetical protein